MMACSHQPYSEQAITPIRTSESLANIWDYNYRFFISHPTPEHFSVCHDLSCNTVSQVSLSKNEWQQITQSLSEKAATSAEEREQIKTAISRFEVIVGKHIGTEHDLAENKLSTNRFGQMDCVDEATNTTVYLRLIEQAGLLRWHKTASRTSRGVLSAQAPHNTATIIDKKNDIRYAVDSWFFANGEKPNIVELSRWKSGWSPDH
ncbi:hypothetical protein LCGC14_0648240 [marine sediment metagenome]|uniref:Uncharacterized protein n=1 Tax=marine sediment metagenome TaxID=412755 RepID=A0A0F9QX46_9ZZZZ